MDTELTPEAQAMLDANAIEQEKAENKLEILKSRVAIEIEAEFLELSEDTNNWLNEIQPPASIVHAAALAAAEVFMAFERGYRMG